MAVGEARDAVQENDATALLAPILTEVQCNLIEAGSVVATPPQKEPSAAEVSTSNSGRRGKGVKQVMAEAGSEWLISLE